MAGKYDHLLPVYTKQELAAEEWRIVVLENGRSVHGYHVSNLGRVARISKGCRIVLKPLWCCSAETRRSGSDEGIYWRICISARQRKGRKVKRKAYFIHRLVALAFVPGRGPRKKYVHHKDNNSTNPRASNLEWVTQSKNQKYAWIARKEREYYESQGDCSTTPTEEVYVGDEPSAECYHSWDTEAPF